MPGKLTIWDRANSFGLVTVNDVAEMLGVDRRTVYKWIDAGLLPARKLPSMGATRNTEWRIRADDVDWFSDGVHMESGFLEPK